MNIYGVTKICINHLYGNRKKFWISTISTIIAFVLMFQSFMVIFSANRYIEQMNEHLGRNRTKLYKINTGIMSVDFDYYERVNEAVYSMKEEYDLLFYQNTGFRYIVNQTEKDFNTLFADEKLIDLLNIKDENGNDIQLENDDTNSYVYLGAELKNQYPVGTTFYVKTLNQTFLVAGYLQKGETWLSQELFDGGESLVLDDYVLALPPKENYDDGMAILYSNNLLFYGENAGDFSKRIEEEKQNNVFFEMESLEECEKEYKEENKDLYQFSYLLMGVMTITAFLSVLIMAIFSWMNNPQELGVLLCNGILEGDLLHILFMEFGTRFLISAFIGTAIVLFTNMTVVYSEKTIMFSVMLVCFIFFLTLMSSAYFIFRLISYKNKIYFVKENRL